MKKESAIKLLKALGAKNIDTTSRTGWVLSECVLAPWRHEGGVDNSPSFGIRLDSGEGMCNCFSCGFGGGTSKLVTYMRFQNKQLHAGDYDFLVCDEIIDKATEGIELDLPDESYEDLINQKASTFNEFPDWWLDNYPTVMEYDWANQYLTDRRVLFNQWLTHEIRADPDQLRVCFPVRDFKGRLAGLHGRALDPDMNPRYRMYTYNKNTNPLVWWGEQWVDFTKPIVIVEGIFDALQVLKVYPNTVCPLFANPSHVKMDRMADADRWITLLDRGKGGDTGRERMKDYCDWHLIDCEHAFLPQNRKDPGESYASEISEVLGNFLQL